MDCREFQALLQSLANRGAGSTGGPGPTGMGDDAARAGCASPVLLLSEAAVVHRANCAACDEKARALTFLELGSSLVADEPREGFEARLRARIAAEGASPEGATWADGVGMLARPALGVALLAMVTALAWSGWQSTRPSADDFGLLAGAEGVLDSVLAERLDDSDSTGSTGVSPATEDAP